MVVPLQWRFVRVERRRPDFFYKDQHHLTPYGALWLQHHAFADVSNFLLGALKKFEATDHQLRQTTHVCTPFWKQCDRHKAVRVMFGGYKARRCIPAFFCRSGNATVKGRPQILRLCFAGGSV